MRDGTAGLVTPPTARGSVRDLGATFLARNERCYDSLVQLLERECEKHDPDTVLNLIHQAAWFATTNHPGRFADGRIENLAYEIGENLDGVWAARRVTCPPLSGLRSDKTKSRRILHVATEVAGIGGHTRTIKNWAVLDRESTHSLLLTHQAYCAIPPWLSRVILESGGQVIVLPPQAPPSAKAIWLREAARAGADLVVSHQFTEDVVPTVAFASRDCPPVAVLNQSDHVFWLGGSVADLVINLREIGREVSERRRGTRNNVVLPIPLMDDQRGEARDRARRGLGFADDRTVLLSVGRESKYLPTPSHDFFATSDRILAENPDAEIYVVGMSEEAAGPHRKGSSRGRLHCVGSVENPHNYRTAADLYLESFPFGSQTAFLEAGLARLAAVPAFAPMSGLLVTSDEAVDGLVEAASDEEDYRARVTDLIRTPEARRDLGNELRTRILACHCGRGWLERLGNLYRFASGVRHAPERISVEEDPPDDDDYGLSFFHAFNTPDGRASDFRGKMRQSAFEVAYQCREWGDYGGASRLLLSAGRAWGYDGRIVRSLAKLAIHWLIKGRRARALRPPEVIGE